MWINVQVYTCMHALVQGRCLNPHLEPLPNFYIPLPHYRKFCIGVSLFPTVKGFSLTVIHAMPSTPYSYNCRSLISTRTSTYSLVIFKIH